MSSKIYTAQEMRETAKLYESMAKDIADIIEEKRSEAQYIRENNDTLIGRMDALKLEEEADRIEAAAKREEESCKQSDTNCNSFGNTDAMREALEQFNAVDLSGFEFPLDGDSSTIYNSNKKEITIPYWRVAELLNGVKAAQDMSKATLSAPPRNCDVGTPDEQDRRFGKWCRKYGIDGDMEVACAHPDMSCTLCALRWAQMPYEEGEQK